MTHHEDVPKDTEITLKGDSWIGLFQQCTGFILHNALMINDVNNFN